MAVPPEDPVPPPAPWYRRYWGYYNRPYSGCGWPVYPTDYRPALVRPGLVFPSPRVLEHRAGSHYFSFLLIQSCPARQQKDHTAKFVALRATSRRDNDAEEKIDSVDDGSFDSGTLEPGDTFEFTFDTAGEYPYYCEFHGGPGGEGMSGTVIVE